MADEILFQLTEATDDLTKEKSELQSIERKLENGIKAVLDGNDFPELRDEIDRLRIRKSELEDIICANDDTQEKNITKEAILAYLNDSCGSIEFGIDKAVKSLVKQIYAYPDGGYSVELGVHIAGSSGWA